MDRYHFSFSEFGAADVAHLTGVSPDQQRDWRRRSILAMQVEGRARFYSPQVAQIILRKALNEAGVPLTQATGAVALGGQCLLEHALKVEGAIEAADGLDPAVEKEAMEIEPAWRYLALPLPLLDSAAVEAMTGKEVGGTFRQVLPAWPATDMDEIGRRAETFLAFGATSFTVIDLQALGRKLASDAERPLAVIKPGGR